MGTLNEIMIDTDNELARIKEGLEITRKRKKINIDNEERCSKCQEKLIGNMLNRTNESSTIKSVRLIRNSYLPV